MLHDGLVHQCFSSSRPQEDAAAENAPWPAYSSVELPGIEPVSGCWSLSRTGTELRNDMKCDSPELTSVDTECAQNVPSQSFD
jgi:hypothetical protein